MADVNNFFSELNNAYFSTFILKVFEWLSLA